MRSFSTNLLLIAGAIIVGIVYLSTFIVDRTQYAVEIRLGDPVSVHMEPGLKFKMPFVTKVFYVDNDCYQTIPIQDPCSPKIKKK